MQIGTTAKIERRTEAGQHLATWTGRLMSYSPADQLGPAVAELDNTGVDGGDGFYSLGRYQRTADEVILTTIVAA